MYKVNNENFSVVLVDLLGKGLNPQANTVNRYPVSPSLQSINISSWSFNYVSVSSGPLIPDNLFAGLLGWYGPDNSSVSGTEPATRTAEMPVLSPNTLCVVNGPSKIFSFSEGGFSYTIYKSLCGAFETKYPTNHTTKCPRGL